MIFSQFYSIASRCIEYIPIFFYRIYQSETMRKIIFKCAFLSFYVSFKSFFYYFFLYYTVYSIHPISEALVFVINYFDLLELFYDFPTIWDLHLFISIVDYYTLHGSARNFSTHSNVIMMTSAVVNRW